MRDHAPDKTLQRAALAQQAGCNPETVRYYEKIGVLPDPPRTASGYRVYDQHHLARLRFVLRARELGFTIDEIRGLLDLVATGAWTCAEIKVRTERHLADVRAKLVDLRRIEKTLATTAAQCAGDERPQCPILDALNT
jgi:MerR family mercuric resistance operon transcriptional regulator